MAEVLIEKRLRWFGYVQRRDKDEATRKILQMTVDGKRNRGRPKLRWWDLVKENMARNQMTAEIAEDRKHWHAMIQAGTLSSVEAERWEKHNKTIIMKKRNLPINCILHQCLHMVWRHDFEQTTEVGFQKSQESSHLWWLQRLRYNGQWLVCSKLVLKCESAHLNAKVQNEPNVHAHHMHRVQMCHIWVKCKRIWIIWKCNSVLFILYTSTILQDTNVIHYSLKCY